MRVKECNRKGCDDVMCDVYHSTKGGTRAIKETKVEAMVEACMWLVGEV